MFPRLTDGRFHVVCQDDELRRSAVIVAAKTYDVYLSHSGAKIARKPGEGKGVASGLGLLFYLAPRSRPVICRARDRSKGRVVSMLLFYCTHCAKMIAADDSESTREIIDRLNEHITECPPAVFTYEGTSNVARRRLGDLRSFVEGRPAGKIRLHR
jgi:hypothetical protein